MSALNGVTFLSLLRVNRPLFPRVRLGMLCEGSGLEGRIGRKDASIFNEKSDLVELEDVCVCVLLMAERASVLSLTH